MTETTPRTHSPAGQFISTGAVRRVIGSRRTAGHAAQSAAAHDTPSASARISRARAGSPGRGARVLRRWSVAELVAQAFASPRPQP